MKSNEDIGVKAAETARKQVLKHCKSVGLSARLTLKRVREGLDALENKVFYDKDRGKCITGPDMINWTARQKAVDQSMVILELKPPEKHELDVKGDMKINIIDKFEVK